MIKLEPWGTVYLERAEIKLLDKFAKRLNAERDSFHPASRNAAELITLAYSYYLHGLAINANEEYFMCCELLLSRLFKYWGLGSEYPSAEKYQAEKCNVLSEFNKWNELHEDRADAELYSYFFWGMAGKYLGISREHGAIIKEGGGK